MICTVSYCHRLRNCLAILLGVSLNLAINPVDTYGQSRPEVKPNQHDQPTTKPKSPEESWELLDVADDLDVDLILADPEIAQPLQITFDTRGRMWLMEYRQYPMPAGLKVKSHDVYWRAVYDKVPPAPPHHDKGLDRISIHEDTNGDGTYDSHKVFVDDLNIATACAPGPDGVWVLNPPYLLFYPDRNHDDIPDGDPEVHLSGFGLQDTHSVANSLTWGPDGWLYAAQGSTVSGSIIRPGLDKKPQQSLGQNIWRYHPQKKIYELFAEGGGNAFCVEIDREGRIFSGHNGGNTRGFHYVQGGYFRKGFSKHGPLSNPYAYGFFDSMQHENVRRFTHSIMRYEADRLPERFHGAIFGVEPLQGTVVASKVHRVGSTFGTVDIEHPVTSEDPWFRPVEIKLGPDGGVYVADWYDGRVAHLLTMQEQVDKTRGRVYRILPKDDNSKVKTDFTKMSFDDLIREMAGTNRTRGRLAMQRMAWDPPANAIQKLDAYLANGDSSSSMLPMFWARYQLKTFTDEELSEFWTHPEPMLRAWSIRLSADNGSLSDLLAKKLVQLAAAEENVDVRSQILCSARRLMPHQTLAITLAMGNSSADLQDPHLPLLHWWNIESVISRDLALMEKTFQTTGSEWFDQPVFHDVIAERIVRRLVQAGSPEEQRLCALLLKVAADPQRNASFQKGFELGIEGRAVAEISQPLLVAVRELGTLPLPLELRLRDPAAIDKVVEKLESPQTKSDELLQLIRAASDLDNPRLAAAVLKLAQGESTPEIRITSWLAFQSSLGDAIKLTTESIPSSLTNWTPQEQEAMFLAFAARGDSASQLLDSVEQEQISKDLVTSDIAGRLSFHPQGNLRERVQKTWGKTAGLATEEMAATIIRLEKLLQESTGDPYNGKPLFNQHCAKCHELFEQGGYVGPNLTPYQRDQQQHLLRNIVNPSLEIREGFEVQVVITETGRVLSGFTTYQDDQSLVLRGAAGEDVRIQKNEIEEIQAQPVSLMPTGILEKLSDQEVVDLFAYLQMAQPLNFQPK